MGFNLYEHDDFVFPVFPKGNKGEKVEGNEQVLEGAQQEVLVLEGADSVAGMAMSAVLAWIDDGDYSYQALAEYAAGIADLDGNEEFNDDEVEMYNDILTGCADALISLGADSGNVDTFLNGEDDEAGSTVGETVSGNVDAESATDEEMIAEFAGGHIEPGILEASFKKMRVVRGGKVKVVKKRIGKVVLSAAQKAGLKKARRKAFSSVAKIHRAKSMKIRKQHGM